MEKSFLNLLVKDNMDLTFDMLRFNCKKCFVANVIAF